MSDEAAVIRVAAEVDAEYGRVGALINNARWTPGSHPIPAMELSVFERVLQSNLIGSFLTTKHFALLMIRSGGRIVYMSSTAAVQANPGGTAYAASKAALNMLSNIAHVELSNSGIRTIAIAPGLTDTPGMRAIVGSEYRVRVGANYPGGRIGQPENLVALTGFYAVTQPSTFRVPSSRYSLLSIVDAL